MVKWVRVVELVGNLVVGDLGGVESFPFWLVGLFGRIRELSCSDGMVRRIWKSGFLVGESV